MKEKLSFLIIEDDPDDIFFLTNAFEKLESRDIDANLQIAKSLKEALIILLDTSFDLIILDLYLPDSQGIDTFLEIQKRAFSIPILIVGGASHEELVRETIKMGAQDYLPKSDLTPSLLDRVIHHAIERHRLHESLKALSFTDELTGLYNRRGFLTLLEQQLSLARRTKKGFYLFFVDLDHLKQINDTYGHLVGDRALIDMAKCLRASFRRHDIIGRLGGDEFGVIVINSYVENGDYLINLMLERVESYNKKIHEPYQIAFSAGKVFYDGYTDKTIDEIFQKADEELYKAKRITHKTFN
jgi:diguanylate cyclase (GGDEF)-like protein